MRPRKSPSSRSNSSMSTDRDIRRSGSEFSMDMSTESFGRITFPYIAQMPSNLRIFMYQELKTATRNFSRALMLGEGGFGCVYRGMIRSVLEPNRKMDVAVKQLGRKGLQVILSEISLSAYFSFFRGITEDPYSWMDLFVPFWNCIDKV